jgi:hypothetical protein
MTTNLVATMEEALKEIPLLDAHTHLDASHLAARDLSDLMLYHMVISDLYSAGCPSGGRLSECPDDEERRTRIEEALPYLPAIQNTSCSWALRIILRDLYGWKEPITAKNWKKLDGMIRERAKDAAWPRSVWDRAKIRRTSTERWRGQDGSADDRFQYSLEWSFFARCQWGEFDTALFELETAWNQKKPSPPLPVSGGKRPKLARVIRTLKDVEAALDHYDRTTPYGEIISTTQHISTDIRYREVTDSQMSAALKRRAKAGPEERDIYASYVLYGFLERLAKRPEHTVFQFSLGAEPLPYETQARLNSDTIAHLAAMLSRFPTVHFQCFNAHMASNQSLCTLARELPNFSLAGYWWHNFFPAFIPQMMRVRLDMLSVNKQVGFFSDAYCVDWAYGKAALVRKMMAQVLAEKIESGQYDRKMALWIAREICFETPQRLLGMKPIKG